LSGSLRRTDSLRGTGKAIRRAAAPGRLILGIDPGLARMGFGVIRETAGKWQVVECGTLTSAAKEPVEKRLVVLFQGLSEVVRKNRPQVMALEQLFFSKNVTTGMVVSQARGVQRMVKLLLGLTEAPKPDDTADALAVALTHAQAGTGEWLKRLQENRKQVPD
jgi:crossover junction endodeoxyribonuclease RuvC